MWVALYSIFMMFYCDLFLLVVLGPVLECLLSVCPVFSAFYGARLLYITVVFSVELEAAFFRWLFYGFGRWVYGNLGLIGICFIASLFQHISRFNLFSLLAVGLFSLLAILFVEGLLYHVVLHFLWRWFLCTMGLFVNGPFWFVGMTLLRLSPSEFLLVLDFCDEILLFHGYLQWFREVAFWCFGPFGAEL